MEYYLTFQNNAYSNFPYSLCFTNIADYGIQQWFQNHCMQIQNSQNVNVEPIYVRVGQREERMRENIIIEPLQK